MHLAKRYGHTSLVLTAIFPLHPKRSTLIEHHSTGQHEVHCSLLKVNPRATRWAMTRFRETENSAGCPRTDDCNYSYGNHSVVNICKSRREFRKVDGEEGKRFKKENEKEEFSDFRNLTSCQRRISEQGSKYVGSC